WPFAVLPLAAALAVITFAVGISQEPTEASDRETPRISTDVETGNPYPFTTEPADPDLQIAYSVNLFDVDATAWRGYYTQWMRQVGEGRGSKAWIVHGLYPAHHLLSFMEQHSVSHLQCPKVTTFDRDYASFITQGRTEQVDHVKLTGTLTPNGMQLAIDVCSQLSPLTTRGQGRDLDMDLKAIHTEVMTKDFADRARVSYRGTTDISADSCVLVYLGDVLPEAGRGTPPSKRLVLLTAERIPLEPEKPRVRP
uniref:hypothetical protein n=1 Tax=Aquisphaera insulae TaxID=2712864 RepID=UPI0013EBA0A6